MRFLHGALAGSALVMLAASPGTAQDLSEKGRILATTHCSRCHVVGETNKFGGISSTPSFKLLVKALDDWHDRFETFHARPPHPSVIRIDGSDPISKDPPTTQQVFLKIEDVDALVAYAETLAQE